MILSKKQLDILNSVVVDGQAWADNAKEEAHVLAKIAKYESAYDEAVAKGGYKTRKQKEDAHEKEKKDRYDNASYSVKRQRSYSGIGDQLDMQYKDLINGTTTWKDHVAKVKSDNPKG
tara:strand:+ start:545 stop:898 length:354 start_codon:yes stop_codon:yes gene_type:complete